MLLSESKEFEIKKKKYAKSWRHLLCTKKLICINARAFGLYKTTRFILRDILYFIILHKIARQVRLVLGYPALGINSSDNCEDTFDLDLLTCLAVL